MAISTCDFKKIKSPEANAIDITNGNFFILAVWIHLLFNVLGKKVRLF